MNYIKNKKNLFNVLISAILSALILLLSFDNILWANFWISLKIPPNYISFSDLRAHVSFLECYNKGINIYEDACFLINSGNAKISTHPKTWIYLFDILNLKNIVIFNIFTYILLCVYFCMVFNFYNFFVKKYEKIIFWLFFFSKSNFILIERLSTDLIIFLVVYFTLQSRQKIIQFFLVYLGYFLKYYPIFLCSLFVEKKKYLISLLVSFLILFIFLFYKDVKNINNNIVEMALPIAYGSRTMLMAVYHISEHYNLFINDNNLGFFRYLVVITFGLYSLILILVGYTKSSQLNLQTYFDKKFIAGSSIFVGTYIVGANVDYRLVFLLFTLPLILKLDNKFFRNIFLISFCFSINSFYFLIGEKISLIFFLSSTFIFLCKFIIFTLLSLLIGSQLKNINFFKNSYV